MTGRRATPPATQHEAPEHPGLAPAAQLRAPCAECAAGEPPEAQCPQLLELDSAPELVSSSRDPCRPRHPPVTSFLAVPTCGPRLATPSPSWAILNTGIRRGAVRNGAIRAPKWRRVTGAEA